MQKHKDDHCGQKVEFFSAKHGGTYVKQPTGFKRLIQTINSVDEALLGYITFSSSNSLEDDKFSGVHRRTSALDLKLMSCM
jgi:hypothetical protein